MDHAAAGLHCYDLDGRPRWQLDLGEFRHAWGYGTSPVLDGDQVILHTGPGKEPFVLWHIERNPQNIGTGMYVDGYCIGK